MKSKGWFLFLTLALAGAILFNGLLPALDVARAAPDVPAAGGTFTVNSTADNADSDTVLTLREAILLANGGTGGDGSNTGLGRALSASEQGLISGCTISSGLITGGCGAGIADTIRFAAGLGSHPTIVLSSYLPGLDDTQGTTLDGTINSVYPTLDGTAASIFVSGLSLFSNNNVVKGVGVTNFGQRGIEVFGSNNLLSNVWAWRSGTIGININGDSNGIVGALVGVHSSTATSCDDGSVTSYGNGLAGIDLVSGNNNQIRDSYIGCNGTGTPSPGVLIEPGAGSNNEIGPNNVIGTNATRSAILPHSSYGVELQNSSNVVISNTIMHAVQHGIYISTTQNTLAGNFISSNLMDGILLDNGAQNNNIGGPIGCCDPYGGNIIVDNGLDGVKIFGANTSGNQLVGNFIGLLSNLSVQGNLRDGLLVDGGAHDNRIGVAPYALNIIAGNQQDGVALTTNAHHNLVEHNYIGTDGLFAKPNLRHGVLVNSGAHDNTIGADLQGNIISFNVQNGVIITGTNTATNTVGANTIYANALDGVGVGNGAFNNSVGTGSCCPNTINANSRHGVTLFGGAHDNQLNYDYIYGNGQSGVNLDGTNTANNEVLHASIHDNAGIGIKETNNAANNWWTQISTYNNGGLGIDKASGTPIHPTIQSVTRIGNAWTISGTATASIVLNPVSVEVYLVAADPSGFGEGKTYLGSASVDGSGNWSMNTLALSNAACFSTFETRSSFVTGISASSDFSRNKCIGSFIYLPLIVR